MKQTLSNPTDVASVLSRIERITPESQRQWGKMNPHQMICHCADQLRFATGEKMGKDFSNILLRTVGKWLILAGMGFPKNSPTLPELDVVKGTGSQPVDFAHDVDALKNLVHTVANPTTRLTTAHPAFGTTNREEWTRLAWLHLDHHLRQFGV